MLYLKWFAAILGSSVVAGIVVISAFLFQAGSSLGFIESVKAPDMVFSSDEDIEKLKVSYPSEKDFLSLFADRLDGTKEYVLANKCATTVRFTNNYDKEVKLESIRFEAFDVKQDLSPVLEMSLIADDEAIWLSVRNTGWSPVDDLRIRCSTETEDLESYFGMSYVEVHFARIEPGEFAKTQFLGEDEITKYEEGKSFLLDNIEAISGDGISVPIEYPEVSFGFRNGGFETYGRGSGGNFVYGIGIDTSKTESSYEENINESVKAKECITVPICFFPDKSCDVKIRISFTYTKGSDRETVSTSILPLHFKVPSNNVMPDECDLTNPENLGKESAMRGQSPLFPFCLYSWRTNTEG